MQGYLHNNWGDEPVSKTSLTSQTTSLGSVHIKERVPGPPTVNSLFDWTKGLFSRLGRAGDDLERLSLDPGGLFLDPGGLFLASLRWAVVGVLRTWCCAAAITGLIIVSITLWYGPIESNYISHNAVRPVLVKKMAIAREWKVTSVINMKMLTEMTFGNEEDKFK